MAVLPPAQRFAVWAEFMKSRESGTVENLLKADIRAAVDALDSFLDTNAATINAAIPLPARSRLSAKQKARLLALVISRRYGVE